MPIIYLKHPVHGAKVATMELEAEYDERSGWERYALDDNKPVFPTVDDVHLPESNLLNALSPRRRRAVA